MALPFLIPVPASRVCCAEFVCKEKIEKTEKILNLGEPRDERRFELLNLRAARLSLKEIAPILAEKYYVKPGTIYDDWESRDE
ncbi:MAG: hypothetical protein QG670_721 [Thermoproteota archaeon]|nr:hypothetical protein [Thermoproteota archaeon]